MTQGYLLSPTILNVLVDTVVRHWESLMAEESVGDDRGNSSGSEVAQLARQTTRAHDDGRRRAEEGTKVREVILHAYNGMVASTNLGCLQTEFCTLTGIFDRAGLKKNFRKTVGMVCHPCWEAGIWSDKAYTWRMSGAGRSYKERQRERVICIERRKELARGSLAAHYQTQHDVAKRGTGQKGNGEGRGNKPRNSRMAFPQKSGPMHCPVEGYNGL